ncbi:MAG: ABC transporter ATP-binding protein [Bacteroidetes bacterium CG12_big_fil_rev_8_21_14_0_65_60_17]|nr:MAG: ABC transporter ATP-binding protein [Bacteroidetes bacterium CG12_big_fil_rev_8_21_14_0_65_60_17]
MNQPDDTRNGLTVEHLCIRLGGEVLVDLDAHIAPGHILTIMGPSGSGKSTLLSVIIGTTAPAFDVSGRILLDGTDISRLPPQKRRVGILFQDDMLFPHLSIGANLAFGLPPGIRNRAQRRARVVEALADIGLEGFEDRDPATLSGGQRARVALMRMLLAEPRALLLDEPFSGLDAALRDHIRELVFTLARERQLPVLLVTHDEADARAAKGERVDLATPG